jgi:hypothetical protein
MKRIIAAIILAGLVLYGGMIALADNPDAYQFRVLGRQTLRTNTGSGVSKFTVPSGTYEALVTVEGGTIRWTTYSTDPTSMQGNKAADGTTIQLNSPYQASGFKFTTDSASSGVTVEVEFYGK